jgi:hypothetical protein
LLLVMLVGEVEDENNQTNYFKKICQPTSLFPV